MLYALQRMSSSVVARWGDTVQSFGLLPH